MSKFGIDVSKYQGTIDWEKVKSTNVEFAIIRAGYGKNTVDGQFVNNVKGCIKYGIPFGVYWFIYGVNEADAIKNADKFHQTISAYKDQITMKVWADLEYDTDRYANDKGVALTKELRTSMVVSFLERMRSYGYDVGNYANPDYLKNHFGDLSQYPLWLADYSAPKADYDCLIWQYSSKGSVNGISGNVDMNYLYEKSEEKDMNTYIKGKAVQLTKNFKSTEFDCNGKGCCIYTPIDPKLVAILQNIRDHFGVSVNLNCGYRCPVHNAKVSGASANSQHIKGLAADIVVKGVHPVRVARYIETIPGFAGRIGCYTWDDKGDGFVHVDVRGTNSRAVYTENNTKYDTVASFGVSVKRGSKGRIVKVVQRKLKAVGFYKGLIDGKCGGGTEKGIIKWNAKYGRKNDASWGPKCWNEAFPK